jgi:hypothetical protein
MGDKRHLPEDFLQRLCTLEDSYLEEGDPIRQSGFGGGPKRWRAERELILDAVDADGDFLDVGCANGYLLQCLVDWARPTGIKLRPFGLDQGARLIDLAREQFQDLSDHFWVGNAWDWLPPRRFRYVYTLTDYVPEAYLREYLARLLDLFLQKDGTLIVGAYGSTSTGQPAQDVRGLFRKFGFPVCGSVTCGELPVSYIAWTRAKPRTGVEASGAPIG